MRRYLKTIHKSVCARAALLGACVVALGCLVLYGLSSRDRINTMAEPLWGNLQKAQDDPETIEEAIERLILAHEEDPTAHLGDGESLQAHKSEEVIDHPAGSLVPDKQSLVDVSYRPLFESLDAFSQDGTYVANTPNGAVLGSAGVSNTAYNELWAPLNTSGFVAGWATDCLLQFSWYASTFSNTVMYMLMGLGPNQADEFRFGIKISGGVVSAHVGYYDEAFDYQEINSTITGVSAATQYVWRIHLDPVAENIYWYLNGTLVKTIAFPSDRAVDGTTVGFYFAFDRTTSGTGYMSVGNVLVGGLPY